MRGKPYTENEDDFIKENYMDMTDSDIAEEIGRTVGSVRTHRKNVMGLTKYSRKQWTDQEEQIVRDLYPDTPNDEILDRLPRHTIHSLYNKAHQMGLKKTDEFMYRQNSELGRKLSENPAAKANQFSKGHEPANKGLKQEEYMSEEAIEATKATRFKEGHKPHNTKWDGAVTIRYDHKNRGGAPYMWIRISEGEWVQYQRYLWEKQNGPIPDDKILACKDGNTLDPQPENWELITRAENAIRNHNPEKTGESLREYWKENEHPARDLTDTYIAGLLSGGDKELREYIIENKPQIIKTARAYYLSRRETMQLEKQE